jgi:hypothetical protein
MRLEGLHHGSSNWRTVRAHGVGTRRPEVRILSPRPIPFRHLRGSPEIKYMSAKAARKRFSELFEDVHQKSFDVRGHNRFPELK